MDKNQNKKDKVSKEKQTALLKADRNHALRINIMISLVVLLLVLPVLTLGSYLYYAIGGRANHLIDIATETIYVTEPNMSLEEMELEEDIGFFTMDIYFDVFKRIGRADYLAGEYSVGFALDRPNFPKRDMKMERPLPSISSMETVLLYHPNGAYGKAIRSDWDILDNLPDGTVGEIYISFDHLMEPDEIEKQLGDNVEVRWVAVDTGLEDKNLYDAGYFVAPIGYPMQADPNTWSPFKGGEKLNAEVFLDILHLLAKDEKISEKISRAKSLVLKERIPYIKQNGIQVYGALVTGSTPELRKLEDNDSINIMKVGEVKLWN